jgi:hypothetical protein
MATNDKDTIYIDIDDEITGIIDKVRSSEGKVVALVLPKRASVFQSIVNMKLLKRAVNDADKSLVLITTESGLMPLAGAAGIYVASSLSSKPEIPNAPVIPEDVEETVEELNDDLDEVTADDSGDVPVGALAGAAVLAGKDDVETVELDNEDVEPEPTTPKKSAKKPKKDKKLNVPNFERFRVLIILGGIALVAIIVGLIYAINVLPKAIISIDTDATSVSIDENIKLSTTAQSLQLPTNTLPAKLAKQTKTYTQQVPATGEKNNGSKAAGEITMTACASSPVNIPAGTGVSTGGKTYITQEDADLAITGGFCSSGGVNVSATVSITAQSGGSKYNVPSGTSFTVVGRPAISATGSATGGTDNMVKVVSESDIAAAKGKININDPAIKKTLENDLKGDNYFPITSTFSSGTPAVKSSANAGDEATSVTVTETVNYTMFGVKEDNLKELIANSAKEQIDTTKQSIINDGVSDAVFVVSNQTEKDAEIALSTAIAVGPQLDIETIKTQSAGKKSGEVKATLQASPDVTNVDVKLSPFWVSSVPKKTDKITVIIAKPKPASPSNDAN